MVFRFEKIFENWISKILFFSQKSMLANHVQNFWSGKILSSINFLRLFMVFEKSFISHKYVTDFSKQTFVGWIVLTDFEWTFPGFGEYFECLLSPYVFEPWCLVFAFVTTFYLFAVPVVPHWEREGVSWYIRAPIINAHHNNHAPKVRDYFKIETHPWGWKFLQ